MNAKMQKLMALAKNKKPMSDVEREAKMSVVKDMGKVASDMMKDGLKGKLEKVTVAASDKAGLEKGLDKAKEILKSPSMDEMDLGDNDGETEEGSLHELAESPEMEDAEEVAEHEEDTELENMDEDAINKKIEELMAKKKMISAKK